MKYHDITNQRFRHLVAKYRTDQKSSTARLWFCVCDCGGHTLATANNLKGGRTRSCGCLRRPEHGLNKTPEHKIWVGMRKRCFNASTPNYKDYGGRGITICDRWDDFRNFLADMGHRPTSKHSIERINNDGNYEPSNCRWATRQEQARNNRHNRKITINGETKLMIEWSEISGVSLHTIASRLSYGWPEDINLVRPPMHRARWAELRRSQSL